MLSAGARSRCESTLVPQPRAEGEERDEEIGGARYVGEDVQNPTPWESQLHAVDDAQELVTVNMGNNDMHFSTITDWLKLVAQDPGNLGAVQEQADRYISELRGEGSSGGTDYLGEMMSTLERAEDERGVQVVVNKTYNPYHAPWLEEGSTIPNCTVTNSITEVIINTLNDELESAVDEANRDGGNIQIADIKEQFNPFEGAGPNDMDHGAGGPALPGHESWVYGFDCGADDAAVNATTEAFNAQDEEIQQGVTEKFDVHPNPDGSRGIAERIKEGVEAR